jgi:hypothetical protein
VKPSRNVDSSAMIPMHRLPPKLQGWIFESEVACSHVKIQARSASSSPRKHRYAGSDVPVGLSSPAAGRLLPESVRPTTLAPSPSTHYALVAP